MYKKLGRLSASRKSYQTAAILPNSIPHDSSSSLSGLELCTEELMVYMFGNFIFAAAESPARGFGTAEQIRRQRGYVDLPYLSLTRVRHDAQYSSELPFQLDNGMFSSKNSGLVAIC